MFRRFKPLESGQGQLRSHLRADKELLIFPIISLGRGQPRHADLSGAGLPLVCFQRQI